MSEAEPVYKVVFHAAEEIYEIYARHVYSSDLYGFVVVEDIVFGERSQVVVDPSEERLKREFAEVSRTYVPNHAILRIDEVDKPGTGEIRKVDDAAPLSLMQNDSDAQTAG